MQVFAQKPMQLCHHLSSQWIQEPWIEYFTPVIFTFLDASCYFQLYLNLDVSIQITSSAALLFLSNQRSVTFIRTKLQLRFRSSIYIFSTWGNLSRLASNAKHRFWIMIHFILISGPNFNFLSDLQTTLDSEISSKTDRKDIFKKEKF